MLKDPAKVLEALIRGESSIRKTNLSTENTKILIWMTIIPKRKTLSDKEVDFSIQHTTLIMREDSIKTLFAREWVKESNSSTILINENQVIICQCLS